MKGFLLSLLLHTALFLLFFFQQESKEPEQAFSNLQIEWVEVQSQKGERGKGASVGQQGRKALKLQNLLPKTMDSLSVAHGKSRFNHGGDDLEKGDNPGSAWGDGGGEFGRIKDYIKIEKVASMMDGLVEFPYPLAYRHIGGVVRVRLVVGEKGVCHWGHTKILGNRAELRFYILLALKRLCSGDFWHRLSKRTSSNIDMVFHFDVYGDEREPPKVLGNVIMYRLPGYQIEGEWRLGPLKGNILAPWMVSLNPTWVVENWNRLVLDQDPLARFQERESEP